MGTRKRIGVRVSEKNKSTGLRRILVRLFYIRSGQAHPPVHIGGYVLVDATPQTDQRTSRMVDLFFSEALGSAMGSSRRHWNNRSGNNRRDSYG